MGYRREPLSLLLVPCGKLSQSTWVVSGASRTDRLPVIDFFQAAAPRSGGSLVGFLGSLSSLARFLPFDTPGLELDGKGITMATLGRNSGKNARNAGSAWQDVALQTNHHRHPKPWKTIAWISSPSLSPERRPPLLCPGYRRGRTRFYSVLADRRTFSLCPKEGPLWKRNGPAASPGFGRRRVLVLAALGAAGYFYQDPCCPFPASKIPVREIATVQTSESAPERLRPGPGRPWNLRQAGHELYSFTGGHSARTARSLRSLERGPNGLLHGQKDCSLGSGTPAASLQAERQARKAPGRIRGRAERRPDHAGELADFLDNRPPPPAVR